MLKTNSKAVREGIKKYIIENYNGQYTSFVNICNDIHETFIDEFYTPNRSITCQECFIEWLQGLPSIINADYYLGTDGHKFITSLLEETPEQAEKYTTDQANHLLSYLIYREIDKAIS